LPLPSEAELHTMRFSRTHGKLKTHHTIQGSLHRFYRRGKENDNDYTIAQVHETIQRLQDEHGINPAKSKIVNFEFGVNITLPPGQDAQVFQKYLVSAHTKAFEKLNPKRPAVGYIAEFNEFSIKIYDKGYHAQTGATDQLRVEIKVNRTRWLDQFGFKKGADLFLTDLLNQDNIKILGDILLLKVRSLILTPREVDMKKLSPKQRLTFYECRDARSWEEWTSKQRERKREQLARIFKKLNQPDPVDVLARLVTEKWQELTTTPAQVLEIRKPRQKVSISTLIVGGIRDILSILKIHESFFTQALSYLVYQPRGIPLSNSPPLPTCVGVRRWIDERCNSPPLSKR